jgi:RNA polymerase sigma factor (TIGR02999 family)
LVHEAYLRLVGTSDQARWDGRGHFFAAAAEAMRRILVDTARRKQSQKHGGGIAQVADVNELNLPLKQSPAQIVAISEALDGLAGVNDKAAELVKLRYFAGFTIAEAAEILGIAPRTADNLWSYARAWLAVQLRGP